MTAQTQKSSAATCSRCTETDPANFFEDAGSKKGLSRICKACHADYQLERKYRKILKDKGESAFMSLVRQKERQLKILWRIRDESNQN